MLKFLKEITNIIQDGLPLTYKRLPKEMSKKIVLEFFPNAKDVLEMQELEKLFGDKMYFYEVEDEKIQNELLNLLIHLKDTFLKKNKKLATEQFHQNMKNIEGIEKKDDLKLEDIGAFIMQIATDVEEGAIQPMKGYIQLKKLGSAIKNATDLIADLAYDDFENWPKDDLPYGYTGTITNRLYAKYEQDEKYAKHKEKLKAREELLKDAIQLHEKKRSLNDEDGCLVEVPEYSYKASLVVKQGRVKKVGNTFITVDKKGK